MTTPTGKRARAVSRGQRLLLGCLVAALIGAAAPRASADDAGWVTLSYRDLIDPDAILRDGRGLRDSLASAPAGYLQPFLDGYASLLPYGLEMIAGPDARPQRDIAARYPPGSAAPAWVALFRGGRYLLTGDGAGRARLFLPGESPAAAWREHYSVVRHALATLLPADGSPLTVEVFAYRNDYRAGELRLRLQRRTYTRRAFPPPGAAPDLAALAAFFAAGGRLEGVRLDPADGLVLYAEPGAKAELAGSPLALADLAVAYRAVRHAGENKPFVSIDPHRDPTRSTVNFGGYLEDTHLGQVVLDADRRFKTITCGLDPSGAADVRERTRLLVPSFLTTTERAFLGEPTEETRGWAATRFWFYAESVGIDVDPAQGLAVITRPYFTADAERKPGPGGHGRRELPWKDRETIRQLNAGYDLYARSFPEIGQLSTVARLLGTAEALRRMRQDWLDLDALLAVELPAFRTPRELTRMLAVSYLATLADERVSEATVARGVRVRHLSPALDRTVEEVFGDPAGLESYLRRRPGAGGARGQAPEDAAALFAASRGARVRELVHSEDDLSALVEHLGAGVRTQAAAEAGGEILQRLRARETELAAALAAAGDDRAPALAEELSVLRADKAAVVQGLHGGAPVRAVMAFSQQILGGIDLQPDHFAITAAAGSPALARFKARTERPGSFLTVRASAAAPTSRPAPAGGAAARVPHAGATTPGVPRPRPATPSPAPAAHAPLLPGSHPALPAPPAAAEAPPPRGTEAEDAEPPEEGAPLPALPAGASITVRGLPGAAAGPAVVGRAVAGGRIVFSREPR
jgi:hypothetical protein